MENLTIAVCEEVFAANTTGDSLRPNQSTATASQVEGAIGQFLVPKSASARLTLSERRFEGRVAYVEYRGAAADGTCVKQGHWVR